MTLLEALIAYCVTSGVLTGDGVDAFRDFTPEEPDVCTVFYEYAGDPPSQFTSAVHRSVQVTSRAGTAEVARQNILKVFNVFHTTAEDLRINFTSSLWGQVYIRQTPFKLGQDESDRVTYVFNLGITTNILE